MEESAVPSRPRQIIAMGGGGFSMEPENLSLDRYVLAQAHGTEPRVSFLPTASGDADSYALRFYSAFSGLPCRPSHLMFFRRTPDLREHVLSQDVIYVGGGNTKSMLGVWREWGLPEILREAWEAGVVLAGLSAGAICWFEQGLTDSFEADLRPLECLGLLKGSCCPHYHGDPGPAPHLSPTRGAPASCCRGWPSTTAPPSTSWTTSCAASSPRARESPPTGSRSGTAPCRRKPCRSRFGTSPESLQDSGS